MLVKLAYKPKSPVVKVIIQVRVVAVVVVIRVVVYR